MLPPRGPGRGEAALSMNSGGRGGAAPAPLQGLPAQPTMWGFKTLGTSGVGSPARFCIPGAQVLSLGLSFPFFSTTVQEAGASWLVW